MLAALALEVRFFVVFRFVRGGVLPDVSVLEVSAISSFVLFRLSVALKPSYKRIARK